MLTFLRFLSLIKIIKVGKQLMLWLNQVEFSPFLNITYCLIICAAWCRVQEKTMLICWEINVYNVKTAERRQITVFSSHPRVPHFPQASPSLRYIICPPLPEAEQLPNLPPLSLDITSVFVYIFSSILNRS